MIKTRISYFKYTAQSLMKIRGWDNDDYVLAHCTMFMKTVKNTATIKIRYFITLQTSIAPDTNWMLQNKTESVQKINAITYFRWDTF